MAARGRGGAGGGRGRGRASLSFNVEQLGLAPGEVLPGPVLQPPLLYPSLEYRPAPLLLSPAFDFQLQLKNTLMENLRKSSAFVRLRQLPVEIGQFADVEQSKESDKPFHMDWSCVPPELKPSVKRKRRGGSVVPNKVARKNIANLTTWFEELEKKETAEETKDTEEEDADKKKDDDEQDAAEGEEVEEDELDEEMDDGTDYNQNYFDSGEGYLDDEDDNLDDGPIY